MTAQHLTLASTGLGWGAGGVIAASVVWRLAAWAPGTAQYAAEGLPDFVYPLVTLAQALAAFGLISGYGRTVAGFTLAAVLCAIILPRTVEAGRFLNTRDPWILLLGAAALAAAAAHLFAKRAARSSP